MAGYGGLFPDIANVLCGVLTCSVCWCLCLCGVGVVFLCGVGVIFLCGVGVVF